MILVDYERDETYTEESISRNTLSEKELERLVKFTNSHYAGEGKVNLYCNCQSPSRDVGLQFQVLKNTHGTYYLRPYKNNGGIAHSTNCERHPDNRDYQKANPLFGIDKDGRPFTRTTINFAKPMNLSNPSPERKNRKAAPTEEERQGIFRSVHEMFVTLSEKFFRDLMENGRIEPDFDETKKCYNPVKAKRFRELFMEENFGIEGYERPLGEYSTNTDKVAFIYESIRDIDIRALEWGNDEKYYVNVFLAKHSSIEKIAIPIKMFRILKNRFSGHYSGRELDVSSIEYDVILAGSYRECDGINILNKGTFIMASREYGMTADSVHEVKYYDMAISHLSVNHNYRKVLFYKPCKFLPAGVYNGKFLPDAILVSKKDSEKMCVIEIWGSNDENYLRNRRWKENWLEKAGVEYIYWDVLNEEFSEAEKRFKKVLEKYAL